VEEEPFESYKSDEIVDIQEVTEPLLGNNDNEDGELSTAPTTVPEIHI
jgi:hypothetical protein